MNSEHYEKYKELYKNRAKTNRQNKLYSIYLRMCERCSPTNNNENYRTYRERGIQVLFDGPKHFIQWSLSNRYQNGLTIDRINAHDHYSPSNCRWITHKENSGRATAKSIIREDGTEYYSIKEAARQNNVSDTAIRNAIKNNRKCAGYKWAYKCDTIMV